FCTDFVAWAKDEFGGAVLGDSRLTKRLIRLADDLSSNPTGSIPIACGGWGETKAAYRLLDNEALARHKGVRSCNPLRHPRPGGGGPDRNPRMASRARHFRAPGPGLPTRASPPRLAA